MSPTILLTAFEPFGNWTTNASLLCLEALLPQLPKSFRVTTRVYPVEFDRVRQLLEQDLRDNYDYCIHLGQAQDTGKLRLESFAINVGTIPGDSMPARVLSPGGPLAYQTSFPLDNWVSQLGQADVPAYVSYHAGTYLCNATMYWSHELALQQGLKSRVGFLHIPLDDTQTVGQPVRWPTLPRTVAVRGVRMILENLVETHKP